MVLLEIETLFRENKELDNAVVEKRLDALVQAIGEEQFSQRMAQYLVSATLPENALPKSLNRFSAIVHDGVEFLIAQTPYHRLKKVILSQLQLSHRCETGERLLHLALHYPTLQKLGQIIARNSSVSKDIRRWLIRLEREYQPHDTHDLAGHIREWQESSFPNIQIEISNTILAKASVAEVIRFKQYDRVKDVFFDGVFKILKPEIEHILEEELEILEKALLFFEKNGEKYGLESMKIAALFDTVRLDLAREIDLLAEQRNLIEAKDIFQDNDRIVIPQLQNFCSHRITAMEYIAGTKITETHLPISKRRDLASLIFEAIICIPLFHQNESSLFHGDPHAGNLLAVADTQTTRPAVALLDWTLAGHLSRNTRMNLMNLLIGIVGEDIEKISEAIEQLAEQDDDRLSQHLHLHMSHPDYNQAHPLRRSFWLLEKLTMDGMLFSAELILFRKAFFTLEGVLEDLCPGFAMDAVMEKYLSNMILKEMPKRLFATISFQADDSGDYQSMLSNEDLGRLTMQQSITAWQQMMKNGATLVETQAKLNNDFLNYFNWFYR